MRHLALFFSARLVGKDGDNHVYNDIPRGSSTKRSLWEADMMKELIYLKDLGSFKMIKRAGGTNILDSTWDFRKKFYPGGSLKKYKAHFCVGGGAENRWG